MKIYNEIVFDVDGKVIYEDSFEYSGDVMLLQEDDNNSSNPFALDFGVSFDIDFGSHFENLVTTEIEESGTWLGETVDPNVLTNPNLNLSENAITNIRNAQRDAQKQGSDIQLNALPSLPSISNVGTVAPTGVINWNAIPGGFQPLPQTVGGRKKLYQLSKFHGGINQKSSPRDIADFECQEAQGISFSSVGRIKQLGDVKQTDSATKTFTAITGMPPPGYGLFEFTAPADQGGATPEEVILVNADGDQVDVLSVGGGDDATFINFNSAGDSSTNVAQIYYAAGNGLYVADANFDNTGHTHTQTNVWVYRNDINASVLVSGWKAGNSLINSPTFHASNANGVELKTSHGDAGADGRLEVAIIDTGSGTWDGTYYFYVSWLFDGGCETGLTAIGSDTFSDETCQFNVSIKHTAHASNNTELGGNKRIEGGRIYFKKTGTAERFLLAEISLIDGVKGALDSTFIPWDTSASNIYDLSAEITFDNPPEIYTYASLNGYYANEVYTKSPDATGTISSPIPLRYKTCVVGQNGIVFVGNVSFDGKDVPDGMMFSMPGKPAVFPKYNMFDSPSSDGSGITALAAFQDTILQFKRNSMYVINVSNPAQFYAQTSFRNCGVANPCQVFTTEFGIIFANKHGCFIYDGQKVISLTGGKFDWISQSGITEDVAGAAGNLTEAEKVPCVGYDPRSQSIIVLKNIGDNSTDTGGWVYNMPTQSWTEHLGIIENVDNHRHTNFIITSEGYLAIKYSNDNDLRNYNHAPVGYDVIRYWTKDLDFGVPTQTKKLLKVYITYKGDGDSIAVKYGVDGETDWENDLYDFSPSVLADKSSDANLESWHVATLVPDTTSEGKDWKSISLHFYGSVGATFEIQDISILYRLRPIK